MKVDNGETIVSVVSNISAQILLAGAQEILGVEGVETIMERLPVAVVSIAKAGPFLHELQVLYGKSGGYGLELRIGRSVFHHGLKHLGGEAGFRGAEFRLLPAPRRLEYGLQTLARMIGDEFNSVIAVSDEDAHWLWRMALPSNFAGRKSVRPCYLVAGMLQEFTAWAGGGRFYRVVETECQSSGYPACVYQIEKKPLDLG
jgi:hypothetical protein